MTARTLGDRYELADLIATGGMGSIYEARDKRLRRAVAVKLLKDELAQEARFIERFKREARSAAALSHDNVARVFDYGAQDGHHFIVMELADGRDLARLLRDEGALSPGRARKIAGQIAAALGHAHAMGLVHRDVKPANVVVGEGDHVKVTDFGIARAAGESTLTATGSVLGTAQYLAPEQAGGEEVSPATDVYALGIVLYEMLTGEVPFTGASPIEVAMRHVHDEVPPPSALWPDVPEDLDRVVERATQKDPRRRYADGNEAAVALGMGTSPTTTAPLTSTAAAAPASAPWGADRLERTLLLVFGALLALAAILAVARIAAGPEDEIADRPAAEEEPAAPEEEEPKPPQEYVIPNFEGTKFDDAKREIEAAGLDFEVEKEDVDSEAEKDIVLGSDPETGAPVSSGGTITLYVSTGKSPDDDDDGPGRGRGRGRGNKKGDDD